MVALTGWATSPERSPRAPRPGVQEPATLRSAPGIRREPPARSPVVAQGGGSARNPSRSLQVVVCGPVTCSDSEAAAAEELGRLLARRSVVVLCGGGHDTVEAVAAGVCREGGTVVGVAPTWDLAPVSTDLSAVVVTGAGHAETATLVGSADAVITVGGCWSTLSMVAMAVHHRRVPVAALHGWQVTDHTGRLIPGIRIVDTPHAAVELVLRTVPGEAASARSRAGA